MSNPDTPEAQPTTASATDAPSAEPVAAPNDSSAGESFADALSQYEKSHARKKEDGATQLIGTVVAVTSDAVLLDIGYKSEGIIPLSIFPVDGVPKVGDKFPVSVKGRNPEGYYELTRGKVQRPTDWPALEKAFTEKATIVGMVTGLVKGGFTVDVGVRAFLPASRSGVREAADMEKLVGQEIRCRISELDVTEEDVVVDRRAVAEEEDRAAQERRYSEIKEGETVQGTVRSLTDYGAFIDLGGVDALLHVSDISWSRVNKPADVLAVGQPVEARILKVSTEGGKRRISVGLKQLQAHPWDAVPEKYKTGERVRGTVTRLAEFGAFVELEPGIEGLIHISEMSWSKGKVRKTSDVVKTGETVEAVILGINLGERRIALGLKQALGDPWTEVAQKFPVGTVIEGPVTNIMKFGAFVQLAEGVEGMVHVSEISAEKRINHPQDALKVGQVVSAQVLAVDTEKRQLRLSMKQLVPTGLDEYLEEHKEGDVVTGRLIEAAGAQARVELGEGIHATCRMPAEGPAKPPAEEPKPSAAKADLSSLGSMLQARWKSGAPTDAPKPEDIRAGQVRSFRISRLDRATKKIELELA
jgi:small subunit ribosomal protein S1